MVDKEVVIYQEDNWDSKFLDLEENLVLDTSHTNGQKNQYLHNINLYWKTKTLLEKVLLECNEAKKDILQ